MSEVPGPPNEQRQRQRQPLLLFIVGPPAVGKMAVGTEIARRTGLRLFHNHQTIDLVLPFFDFGSPPFARLVGEFRRRIFEEVAVSKLPGLIFTYVWAFNMPGDAADLESYASIFLSRQGRVLYVELAASQAERLRRNETPLRLQAKPHKRDLARSRKNLIDLDLKYRLNSSGEFDGRSDYLRIDNTDLSVEAAAEQVILTFQLRRRVGPTDAAELDRKSNQYLREEIEQGETGSKY